MYKSKWQHINLLACLIIITSCGGGKQSNLLFKDRTQSQTSTLKTDLDNIEKKRAEFAMEKARVWEEINNDAKATFENVKDVFTNKCMNCHDSSFKLPFYGRILEKINPVTKHQVEGLKSFNFAEGFPFQAQGNPPQIAILKSIKNSITERTMPIKSFTTVYPKKKINEEDEKIILSWIDPIIEKIDNYEVKYNSANLNLDSQAHKILEMKCFRCHASGNARGGFGGMENTEALIKGKYVSPGNPEQSQIFTTVRDGKMPPSKLETLSAEEQYVIRDWLEKVTKTQTR